MSTRIENQEYDIDSSFNAITTLPSGQVYLAVLNAAIKLNLFEIIGKGSPKGMSPSEIVSKLPRTRANDADHRLDRMLFLLANHSLLTCSSSTKLDQYGRTERLYGLSPLGRYLFQMNDEDDGASCVSILKLTTHPTYLKVWQNFEQVILDEEKDVFKKVNGMSAFQYMEMDPTFKTIFHKAMADISIIQMKAVLETYKGFEGISTLVDVAGGIGQCLKMIISKYPLIQGINFDLPQVVQRGLSHSGITHVGGDMFKSIPQGDAIMIKTTTHNWGDEDCIKILKNCHKSLKKNGKLIIIDLIMPEMPNASDGHKFASMLDNIMFLFGGKERTEKEFEALCKAAGFSSYCNAARVASTTLGVIELHK